MEVGCAPSDLGKPDELVERLVGEVARDMKGEVCCVYGLSLSALGTTPEHSTQDLREDMYGMTEWR